MPWPTYKSYGIRAEVAKADCKTGNGEGNGTVFDTGIQIVRTTPRDSREAWIVLIKGQSNYLHDGMVRPIADPDSYQRTFVIVHRPGSIAIAAIAAIACLGASCHGNDIVRIEVASRHIVLYGHNPLALPVRLIDRAGNAMSLRDVKVRVSSDSAVRLLPGALVCDRAGAADVEVQAGALKELFYVRCRPASVIRTSPFVEMTVGGSPRPLRFEAAFPSGDREVVRPLSVVVGDS